MSLILSALLIQAAAPPAPAVEAPTPDVVVIAHVPHCLARSGDPADAIDVTPRPGEPLPQIIRPDWKTGKLGVFLDDFPPVGPTFWQRNGSRLDDFRFRVPENEDGPYCIGSKQGYPGTYASVRRGFDAKPYLGKVVRFTAYVATWRAGNVIFWLAGGAGKYREGYRAPLGVGIMSGGNSEAKPIKGTHSWMPISYTIGPVDCSVTQISYGVVLDGGGDVWFYKPKFEVVPEAELPRDVRHKEHSTICKDTLF